MNAALISILLASTAAVAGASDDPAPLSIRVSGRTGLRTIEKEERKTLAKELNAKAKTAEKATKELEKQLKKQHGKKRERWPADAQEQLEEVERESASASHERDYGFNQQKDIDDSVMDLEKYLGGKKIWKQVESAEEADFVIEVLGRTLRKNSYPYASSHLYARVSPGSKMDAALLVEQDLEWLKTRTGRVYELHVYTEEEPFWEVEFEGDGILWGFASKSAAGVIDKFAKDNYDSLVACRIAQ